MLVPDSEAIGRAILERADVRRLEPIAAEAGMVHRWERAIAAIEAGLTSPAEARRSLGLATPPTRRS